LHAHLLETRATRKDKEDVMITRHRQTVWGGILLSVSTSLLVACSTEIAGDDPLDPTRSGYGYGTGAGTGSASCIPGTSFLPGIDILSWYDKRPEVKLEKHFAYRGASIVTDDLIYSFPAVHVYSKDFGRIHGPSFSSYLYLTVPNGAPGRGLEVDPSTWSFCPQSSSFLLRPPLRVHIDPADGDGSALPLVCADPKSVTRDDISCALKPGVMITANWEQLTSASR
jgi:hypothetical protein